MEDILTIELRKSKNKLRKAVNIILITDEPTEVERMIRKLEEQLQKNHEYDR